MAPNPLLRSRPHTKKSFGEAFGAATGVSDPRLQKIRIRNNGAGGRAAPVAGYARPGFHTWPSGHIPKSGSESASSQPVPCQKIVRRGVRRRDRGQRPTATKDPDTKQQPRRQSRHWNRVRRPRFPHLAFGPHPSRQWLRIRFFAAGPIPKNRSERRSAPRPGSATHGYRRSGYGTTTQAAEPPLEPSTPAPISTLGLRATSLKTMAPNPLRRIRSVVPSRSRSGPPS
jgi:hypothetical protein